MNIPDGATQPTTRNTYHELKCWPEYFEPVWLGYKKFEIRKFDRDFKVNDALDLKEYIPATDSYTGRVIECLITYMTCFNQMQGYVVLGVDVMEKLK